MTNKAFRINVIVFSSIGMILYLLNILTTIKGININPLYREGAYGIPVSIVGGTITYFYYKHMQVPIYKTLLFSAILFVLWIIGVMYIGSTMTGIENRFTSYVWIGILTLMYFMMLGGINGYFGWYISLFNVGIIINALFQPGIPEPIVWLSILGLIGIENIYVQWAIVIVSALLGLSKQGIDFFEIIKN